jgi:hypothetical protein
MESCSQDRSEASYEEERRRTSDSILEDAGPRDRLRTKSLDSIPSVGSSDSVRQSM